MENGDPPDVSPHTSSSESSSEAGEDDSVDIHEHEHEQQEETAVADGDASDTAENTVDPDENAAEHCEDAVDQPVRFPPKHRTRRHKPMSSEEQKSNIASLQARLALFQHQSPKKIENQVAVDSSPVKTEKRPPPKKKKDSESRKRARSTVSPKRSRKRNDSVLPSRYRVQINKLNFLPEYHETLRSNLDTLARPFEEALTQAVDIARGHLPSQAEDLQTVLDELERMTTTWIKSNREHLGDMISFLSRRGVLSIGAVEVPGGEIVVDACSDPVEILEENLHVLAKPFEEALGVVGRIGSDYIAAQADGEGDWVDAIDELGEKKEAWKLGNREALGGLVGVLERFGVLRGGMVKMVNDDERDAVGGMLEGIMGMTARRPV